MPEETSQKDLTFVIVIPSQQPRGKGINSTSGRQSSSIKMPKIEMEMVKEAAKKCGISNNSFMRQCCVNTAKKILKLKG